ncbi:general odorant-binding protein 72-like [Hyposmocoma kahamanoa]|uniref:general odorant-binding protein 72-like n=1 Tax=Hyposmocoma kahamanoa TaxID=1477025 RepID=UPI000E6D5FF9|nr:general odorant-binding protein 72-like [Hyposmocoma kahamanoa]
MSMTKQQLKNSMKLLRKTCLGKSGVEEDKIQGIMKGIFIEEKEVMCYIACVYQMSQIVKNNKLNYDASLKQVDLMYPNEMKESAKRSIEICKDVATKYEDLCESSYWTSKCIYESDPKNFLFP